MPHTKIAEALPSTIRISWASTSLPRTGGEAIPESTISTFSSPTTSTAGSTRSGLLFVDCGNRSVIDCFAVYFLFVSIHCSECNTILDCWLWVRLVTEGCVDGLGGLVGLPGRRGAEHTAEEIAQQPQTWPGTLALCRHQRDGLRRLLANAPGPVLLGGAGPSDFVGRWLGGGR